MLTERPPEFSVTGNRVLKGRTVIAFVHPAWGGRYRVATPEGRWIGHDVSSRAEAMLLAIRHLEAPRT